MGRVRAPYGLKGWIKVQPFTQEIEGLLDYPQWWVGKEGDWRMHRVQESAVQGATVVARLDGITDRDLAMELKGRDIAVPRAAMPDSGRGEYYWNDLLGLRVFDKNGACLGQVQRILETGANSVLVVRGAKEILIPFIQDAIVEVDVAGGRMAVDWVTD